MTHLLQLLVLVLLTLLCLCYLGLIGIATSLLRRGITLTRLPWLNSAWFYALSFTGVLLSTSASYLRYFRGSPLQQSVADTCSIAGLLAYAIAFFVIRKPWKAFVAAHGGTTWAVVVASQQRLWQATLRRDKS
jgi:hypothetical protein